MSQQNLNNLKFKPTSSVSSGVVSMARTAISSSSSSNSKNSNRIRQNVKSNGEKNDETFYNEMLEQCQRNIIIFKLHELKLEQEKLQIRELKLSQSVENLKILKERYERLKNENDRRNSALRKHELLKVALDQARQFEQFAETIEPFLHETIPLNLSEENFSELSNLIKAYEEKTKDQKASDNNSCGLEVARQLLEFMSHLNENDAFFSDFCRTRSLASERITEICSKSDQKIEKLEELGQEIQKLQNINQWLSKRSI